MRPAHRVGALAWNQKAWMLLPLVFMPTMPTSPFQRAFRPGGRSRWQKGFTLVESMVSLAVLVVSSVGCVFSFMMLNQYAANLRNISSAKELCQERIEQVRGLTFTPPATTPLVPGQDGKFYFPLGMPSAMPSPLPTPVPPATTLVTVPASGATADYNSSGVFTGGSGQTTLTEPVTIYAPRDGTTASAVTGTRTTTVALSSLADQSVITTGTGTSAVTSAATKSSLNLIQFTVTVAYTFRGQSYTYSMYTLRGTD